MAEALSIVGGIAATLQIGSTVVDLITSVRDAPQDRHKLLAEIHATTAPCQTLLAYSKMEPDRWTSTIENLSKDSNGPVQRFDSNLRYLHQKLSPKPSSSEQQNRFEKYVYAVTWPFTKKEIQKLLEDMERQKSLINLALVHDTLQVTLDTHGMVGGLSKDMNVIRHETERKDRMRLLSDLTSIDFESAHTDISSRRATDTGQWLLQSEKFRAWLESSTNSFMWCQGIPGSGKTILASLVVDDLLSLRLQNPKIGVAGLYCSYRDPHELHVMLGSLLQQLVEPLDVIPPSVVKHSPIQRKDFPQAFSEILASYTDVFVIVDALDECSCRLALVQELRRLLLNETASSIRIFMTGRSGIVDFDSSLKADIQLEIRSDDNDVRLYLHESLRSEPQLSTWISKSPEFEQSMVETILPRLSGMFLLARLYVNLLAQKPSLRDAREALKRLPNGIHSTYDDAWNRIGAQAYDHAELGRNVLMWIVCAARPLRIQEILHGLAIVPGDDELDSEGIPDAELLTNCCAGLVIFNEQSKILELVHPTTNEYFKARKDQLFPTGDQTLAIACTTYLLVKPFIDRGPCRDSNSFFERCAEHSLLAYAAAHWGTHVKQSSSEVSQKLSLQLLQNENTRASSFQALLLDARTERSRHRKNDLVTKIKGGDSTFRASQGPIHALQFAAYFGLTEIAERLPDYHLHINDQCVGGAAVHWAITGKQNAMLDFLLKHGADPNAERKRKTLEDRTEDRLPIHLATRLGNATAIQNLLEYKVDMNRLENSLLTKNIASETSNVRKQQALATAAFVCHFEFLSLLLKSGANVDGKVGAVEQSVLDAAAFSSKEESTDQNAECLLHVDVSSRQGIEGNRSKQDNTIKSGPGQYALHHTPLVNLAVGALRESAASSCFDLLVAAGANVNLVSVGYFWHPDADWINATGSQCELNESGRGHKVTAVITAAYYGAHGMLRRLVEQGADINLDVGQGHTALAAALRREIGKKPQYPQHVIKERFWGAFHPFAKSTQDVKATLDLLVELGANPALCSPPDKARIEQLLTLPAIDYEALDILNYYTTQCLGFPYNYSIRDNWDRLKELERTGINPALYQADEKARIEGLLSCSVDQLDVLEEERRRNYEKMQLSEKRQMPESGEPPSDKTPVYQHGAARIIAIRDSPSGSRTFTLAIDQ